jgi:hypothetical protein
MPTRTYFAAGTLLLVALGCRDDTSSPTEPAAAMPEAAITQTITLVSGNAPIGEWDLENQVSLDGGATFHDAFVIERWPTWAAPLPSSQWITGESGFEIEAPPITMLFRRPFTLPAGFRKPSFAIEVFADNHATVFLNGTEIGQQSLEGIPENLQNFQEPPDTFTAPAGLLHSGANTLTIELVNAPDGSGNPSGLDYKATITSGRRRSAGVQRITAGGTFTQFFPEPVGSEVTFSVNAIKHRDGTVTGKFEYVTHIHEPSPLPVDQIHTHGDVHCFVVEGNLVIIGGVVTKSNTPEHIGVPSYINLTDRGEGPNDPRDLASGLWDPPGSFAACAERPRADQFPLRGGNVKVHRR